MPDDLHTEVRSPAGLHRAVDKPRETVKLGEEKAAAVAKLKADLAKPAGDMGFKVGDVDHFGLRLDVFDPETALLFSAARPARRDTGAEERLMTVGEVVATIQSARSHAQRSGKVKYVDEHPAPPPAPAPHPAPGR